MFKHRQWGEKDMLYFCPVNKIIWQYDRSGKIHKFADMPTYGVERKELPNGKTQKNKMAFLAMVLQNYNGRKYI